MAGSPKITEEVTRRVAELARLELSAEEVTTHTAQLCRILDYVEQIMEPDVEGVEPLTHPVEISMAFREDDPRDQPLLDRKGRPLALESAPEVMGDGYKVPPIL